MSESIFASIIEEWAERDWESYADAPTFITSKKHDRAMRRIFKRYERNTRHLRPQAEIRVRTVRRRIAVILLVIILAVITGFTAAYFISQSFRGEIHKEYTELFPIDRENCPEVIEEKYYLSELPEGFEEESSDSSPFYEYIRYKNTQTGQTIAFEQWAKPSFDSTNLNTEKGELVEVEINGHNGYSLELDYDEQITTNIIWDNGDYIIKISGNLSKNELILLANSTKVYNESNS